MTVRAPDPPGLAGVFDRSAETYDAVGVPFFGPIAERLVAELAVRPGERVLDVGCGRGAALLPLARAAGPTGQVLGIDLSPRMVALTSRDAVDLPQVEVRVADACAPGLPPGSYDVVAASLVLFFLPDPAAVLAQWVRLLVDGGRLGVTTFGLQDPRWQEVEQVFRPYLPAGMRDARTTGATGPFASDDGVEELFRGAGLREVRTVRSDLEVVFSGAEQLVAFTWSHGQRAMWEAVPEAERPRVTEEVLGRARVLEDRDGALRLVQGVRCTLGRR